MSTGHVLPGYGDPHRRARSAYSSERSTAGKYPGLSTEELTRIKEEAKRMWTPVQREPTTYGHFYTPKNLSVQSTCRPTSPTRRNNPHPPQVFLMNRLHYIPGYHNPDTTMGKEVYRVDASLPPHLQAQRREPREKYRTYLSTASINQYRPKNNSCYYLRPTQAQAIEAWGAMADQDRADVLPAYSGDHVYTPNLMDRSRNVSPKDSGQLASLHRYLRPAGVSESDHLLRVMETQRYTPEGQHRFRASLAKPEMTLMDMREADLDAIARVRVKRHTSRGDFLIHPEWPPYMPHHRIPGVCN